MDSGFRIPDSGFRFQIPAPDSGFRFPGIRVAPQATMYIDRGQSTNLRNRQKCFIVTRRRKHMPCHLEAEVSPVVFFSLKTLLIRALLSTSYVDSFDRKLLDSDL